MNNSSRPNALAIVSAILAGGTQRGWLVSRMGVGRSLLSATLKRCAGDGRSRCFASQPDSNSRKQTDISATDGCHAHSRSIGTQRVPLRVGAVLNTAIGRAAVLGACLLVAGVQTGSAAEPDAERAP